MSEEEIESRIAEKKVKIMAAIAKCQPGRDFIDVFQVDGLAAGLVFADLMRDSGADAKPFLMGSEKIARTLGINIGDIQ